jgi:hypothetical protein
MFLASALAHGIFIQSIRSTSAGAGTYRNATARLDAAAHVGAGARSDDARYAFDAGRFSSGQDTRYDAHDTRYDAHDARYDAHDAQSDAYGTRYDTQNGARNTAHGAQSAQRAPVVVQDEVWVRADGGGWRHYDCNTGWRTAPKRHAEVCGRPFDSENAARDSGRTQTRTRKERTRGV